RICCMVDRRRLVCIDPGHDAPVWNYASDADFVGVPQLVDGLLVVALQSGRFIALDPASGKPKNGGYRLNANVAPSAAPVPFGTGRLLAPLSDGTVIVLDMKQLGG